MQIDVISNEKQVAIPLQALHLIIYDLVADSFQLV